jgi:ABC-type nitrate/sulfonate/bicarbonate transport system permease component
MSATVTPAPSSSVPGPEATASGPGATRRLLTRARAVDPLGLIGVVAIGLTWHLVTRAQLVDPLFLPPLTDIAAFWRANFLSSPLIAAQSLGEGGISSGLIYSVTGVWIAVLISVAVGLPLGLVSARVTAVRMFSDPLLLTVSGIPILIMAPFFMIWFGPARTTQLLLLIVFCTPVIYIYAQRAVDNLDPVYEANARVFGASRPVVVRDIYPRGTLPEVLGGLRIALAGSWGLGAISELMGAPQGIGKLIVSFATNTNVVAIWAVVLSLAVVAVLTDLVLVLLTRFLNRWMP